jgi:hypothetical protein
VVTSVRHCRRLGANLWSPDAAIDARKRASIVCRGPKFTITTESAGPNRLTRFVQKIGFGERR